MDAAIQIIRTMAPWAGLSLMALIFLANAMGLVNQSVAVRELSNTGVPPATARLMVNLGRLVQLLATPCLFFSTTRVYAAILLAAFMVGATLAAHAFWRAAAADRDRQLVNFLKNTAIIGGLLVAAAWSG